MLLSFNPGQGIVYISKDYTNLESFSFTPQSFSQLAPAIFSLGCVANQGKMWDPFQGFIHSVYIYNSIMTQS